MTDTVEAIVAEMRKQASPVESPVGDEIDPADVTAWADRLQSAHDAEVGALRETNRRMNRRVQIAEAALPSYRKLIALPPDGDGVRLASGNFGRALLTWHCEQLSESLESAEARLREAERDARRYGFLRDVGPLDEAGYPTILQWKLVAQDRGNGKLLFGDDLDAAIDRAMEETR